MKKEYDILIIDDEQVVIDSVVKVVSSEGFKIDSAENASKALKKIMNNQYRLIICAIMMPEMNGFQFLKEINNMNNITPVIMTSGYSTIDNAIKSLLEGAIGFLPKPFTMNELMSRILRGLKYMDIKKMVEANDNNTENIYRRCPGNYFRLGNASWVYCQKENSVLIGACDLYLKTIDSIMQLELLDINDLISKGVVCAKFRTENNLTYNLLSPISGRIVERNENILNDIEIMIKDPFVDGWLYRIIPSELVQDLNILKTNNIS